VTATRGWRHIVLLTAPLLVLAGCGGTAGSPPPSPSAIAAVAPSPAVSQAATLHVFGAQGFALAYGKAWSARFPDGRRWSAKDAPPGQAPRWTMTILGPTVPGEAGRGEIVVTLHLDNAVRDPGDYQREAARELHAEHGLEVFRPTTVDRLPALMAVTHHPRASPVLRGERYVVGTGGVVYELEVRAPRAAWPSVAPAMRAIVQSFMQPGG